MTIFQQVMIVKSRPWPMKRTNSICLLLVYLVNMQYSLARAVAKSQKAGSVYDLIKNVLRSI